MNAQIYCRMRGGSPLSFSVAESESVLGRDPRVEVSVPMDGVSRRHAKISWDGHSHWLEDLKSTNGTFVNGAAIRGDGKERLRHLDVIGLGAEVDLLFLIRDKPVAVVRQGIVRATLVPDEGEPFEVQLGEATLGRAPVNNLVIDSSAVSKFHAAVRRTADFLALRDLGSANGTLVNGAKVQTAMLKDGDRLSLSGVVNYRVRIEMGEVQAAVTPIVPLTDAAAAAPPPPTMMMQYTSDWRLRVESGDIEDVAGPGGRPQSTAPHPTVSRPTSPAPAPPTAVPPVAAKPPAPPAAATKAAAPPPAPAKPAAIPKPTPGPPPAPIPTPTTAGPPPMAKPAAVVPPAPPRPVAPAPAPAFAAPLGPIKEVRLIGADVELAITQPGSYEAGRSKTVPLRVSHPTVSRSQAKFVLAADRSSVAIDSVGAASPAMVKGTPLTGPVTLADGDEITFGQVKLTVKIQR